MLFRGMGRLGFLVLVLAVQCQQYRLLLRPAHIQNRQALKALRLLLLVLVVMVGMQLLPHPLAVAVGVVQLLSIFQLLLFPVLLRLPLALVLIHLVGFVLLRLAVLEALRWGLVDRGARGVEAT
jgi:hypothetical protein